MPFSTKTDLPEDHALNRGGALIFSVRRRPPSPAPSDRNDDSPAASGTGASTHDSVQTDPMQPSADAPKSAGRRP